MPDETKVTMNGKVFTNPEARLVEAANRALLDIAVMGAVRVQMQMKRPGLGRVSGHLRGRVAGHIVSSLHAQIDAGEARFGRNEVYARWVEGVDQRNKTSRFKGHFFFRNVRQWLLRGPKEVRELMQTAIYEAFA